jgi:hypothetical protein
MNRSNVFQLFGHQHRRLSRHTCRLTFSLCTALLIVVGPHVGFAQTAIESPATDVATASAEPTRIELADIMDHVNQLVEVELKVQSSKFMNDRDICFLNSEVNYRELGNATVVIKTGEVLDSFAAAGVAEPAEHYLNKTIRVIGQVTLHNELPQLVVTKVEQIQIIEPQPEPEDAPEPTN